MTKIGIFTHSFYSEVMLNNFRIPGQYSGGFIETNVVNSNPEVARGVQTERDEAVGFYHHWIPDSMCVEYSQMADLLIKYDWIILANHNDSFNWVNVCERLSQSLQGRASNEVLYFPSRLMDGFGEIQSKSLRKFPGNPYTWSHTDYPLTHFCFNRYWLPRISARIFPTGAMISSFFLGLLMKDAPIIRCDYELGNTFVDGSGDVEMRGLGLVRRELLTKVKASSCITRQKWGFPTPSNLTKKLIYV